ncbi:MAG: four helix bundle protein [Candidatus Omnitrophota bacterium]
MVTPRHEKLWIWQKAHKLRLKISNICQQLPTSERYKLSDQIERSSNAIADNIAEGNSSYYYNDKIKSLHTARKEAGETQNHLRHMEDKKYLDAKASQQHIDECEEILRGINGLIRTISEKRDKGYKKGAKRI